MVPRAAVSLNLLFACTACAFSQPSVPNNRLAELSQSVRRLTNRIAPAVVEVVVSGYRSRAEVVGRTANSVSPEQSSGSGILVDPNGYIMTNAHVVDGAVRIRVFVQDANASPGTQGTLSPDAQVFNARILGIDRDADLALLKIDVRGLTALGFGDSDKVRQGDLVFAVGSPLGLRNSLSMGVVSSAARALTDDTPFLYIQTDAPINPGNSGGALVDTTGDVIGMNTFIVSQSGGNEGIGFAIPSNIVRDTYDQLRRTGKVSRGNIGVVAQDISPVMARGLGLSRERGVIVADVDPNGPADRSGMKRKDVVLDFDGHPINTTLQLANDVFRRKSGEKARITVLRGNDRLTLTVEIHEQATPFDPLTNLVSPEKNLVPRLGIYCIEIDRRVAELLPDLRRQYGLIVVARSPDGQAQFIDLEPGDVIHAINNFPVSSLASLQNAVQRLKPGDAVVLQIERDQRFQYLAFEIE
jgi:serine protease Do